MKAWWVHAPQKSAQLKRKLDKAWKLVANSRTATEAVEMVRSGDIGSLMRVARRRLAKGELTRLRRAVGAYAKRDDYARVEQEMFGVEPEALKAKATLHPEHIDGPNSKARVAALAAIDPYLILTFGGPLLRARILNKARGFAVNQHAGWSPWLKGASTTETALYHREIGWVGNTVHLMDTHADSGHILRRSTATIHPDDSVAHCFFAVCAVGSELMLESINTMLHEDELRVFPQPRGGQTVLNIDFKPAKRDAIARDIESGWLGDAIQMAKDF